MRRLSIAIFLLLIFCAVAGAKKSKKSSSGGKKSSSPSKKPKSAADRLQVLGDHIPFTFLSDTNFSTFVAERPRPYHALLMFTATDKRYQCSVCARAKQTFVEASKYYHDQYSFENENPSNRITFFVVDVDSSRNTFNEMGLETVPRVYMLPPTLDNTPKLRVGDYEIPSQSLLEGAKSFLQQMEDRSKIKVIPTINPWPYLIIIAAIAYILAFLASTAAFSPSEAILWYRSKYIWVVISTICFCVGVSGSIYCIIRSAPMYGMNQYGNIQIFAGAGRDQYLLEGILVAAMTVGCGIAGCLMYYGTSWKYEPISRHIFVILGLSIFIVCGLELGETYKLKTQWYRLQDTVPAPIWAWITSSVKKTSGIPKRLLRLSEVWLETKNIATFYKKANVLLVEYVKRAVGM